MCIILFDIKLTLGLTPSHFIIKLHFVDVFLLMIISCFYWHLSMISVKTKRMQGDTGGRINQRKMVIFEQPSLDWSHRKREVKLSRVILNICVYIFGKVNACTYALSCFQYFYTGERNINTHADKTCSHNMWTLLHVFATCTHTMYTWFMIY